MSLFDKRLTKIILLSFNIFLFSNVFPTFSKLLKAKNDSSLSSFDNEIKNINNKTLENILIKNDIRLDHFIYHLTSNNLKTNDNDDLYIDIESDRQYRENDIYYAEGNVLIKLKNGNLKADKFFYDKKNSEVELKGNISFFKGQQNFKAKLIKYNFELQEGFINDISGSLSLDNLDEDLNLYQVDKKSCSKDELDLLNLPEELELLNSKNARLNNILGVNLDFGKISNWKFKSKKITIHPNSWKSDKVEFTNDPYENPQFIVESNNFSADIIDDAYKFKSKSTFINLENKLRIPIGNRTISDGDVSLKWGVGYDKAKRDGLYIYRSSDIFRLTKNLDFSYKPYFLIQRAIRGKTGSFRIKDASYLDDKSEQITKFSDYLAIESDIKGKIFNFDSNINFDLGSLNTERLNDSLSINANFLKTLYSKSNQESKNTCSIKDDLPYENFSLKNGFYYVYLKDNIYTGYGTKLLTNYTYEDKNISDDYSLIFDLGSYKSKSRENNNFLSLDRYGINVSFNRRFRIFDLNNQNQIYNSRYDKTPRIIDKAFFLNTKLSTSYYEYSNKESQSAFFAGMGPSFTIGDLKNDFFDYSFLSVMPEFINKKGESPFGFDNLNSDSRIKFVYKQQLYGPILLGLSSDLIISNKSKNYGKFKNIEYSIDFSRRAYKVSLFYKNTQSFGLKFNIFSF